MMIKKKKPRLGSVEAYSTCVCACSCSCPCISCPCPSLHEPTQNVTQSVISGMHNTEIRNMRDNRYGNVSR